MPKATSVYTGPEISRAGALDLHKLIKERAIKQGVEAISIVTLNSDGVVILSEGDETEAAEAKAKSALLQTQDTIMFQHTWNETTDREAAGWVLSESPLLDSGDLSEIREKLESNFSLEAGGTLIKSEGGAGVIGAIGIVTGQSEIIDHELASLRPRLLAVA